MDDDTTATPGTPEAPDYEPTWTFEAQPEDRRTPVKVAHLVIGLVFLGISGLWLLDNRDIANVPDAKVLLPGLLILAGVVGLVAATLNNRNRFKQGELR